MLDLAEIHRWTQYEDRNVRVEAVKALGAAFSQVYDKTLAWHDLHRMTEDVDSIVRRGVADALGEAFSQLPDKTLAWQDLIRLARDGDSFVRRGAAKALSTAFSQVPDKTLVWQDLHTLVGHEDRFMRQRAADVLGAAFSQLPDKASAWQDLHTLVGHEDSDVRRGVADALGATFGQLPDKTLAWHDLHRLTQDDDSIMRWRAAEALGDAFSHVPDKTLAWHDLHRLTQDEDSLVRRGAEYALGAAFGHIPDKTLAWHDLHRLTGDEDISVRWEAARSIEAAFSQIPNKTVAWQDLIKLTQDENSSVRWGAARVLGAAFSQVLDRNLAWQNLHKLTQEEDSDVRGEAAGALGSAFSQLPDKNLAWHDLHRLTHDEDSFVRMHAYHSLGRATISKAIETADKDAMIKELEAAVAFFEKSSRESVNSPARFCSPFYRSYFAITFQGAKEDEVQRYIAEAKEVIGGSKIKDELLKAVESLAQALKESQKLKGRSLEEISSDLSTYRWYCDEAASHMATAEKDAPGAVKLMRKCNPFLEEQIQVTIAEIQKKAMQFCQITRGSGTEYEAPVTEINRAAKALSLEDIHKTQRSVTRITSQLKELCMLLPDNNKRKLADGAVSEVELAPEFPDKLDKIELAIAYVGSAVESALQSEDVRSDIKQVLTKLDVANNKLDEIRYAIFKQRISSGNAISNLNSITTELEKLHQLSLRYPESSLKELYSCREEQLEELSEDLENRFTELNEILKQKASRDDIKKLEGLKPAETWSSKFWDKADKGATLLTYISFLKDSITILTRLLTA